MTHVKYHFSLIDRECAGCEREIHQATQYGRAVHTCYGKVQEDILCMSCASDFGMFSYDVCNQIGITIEEILEYTSKQGDQNRRDLHCDDLMNKRKELT